MTENTVRVILESRRDESLGFDATDVTTDDEGIIKVTYILDGENVVERFGLDWRVTEVSP